MAGEFEELIETRKLKLENREERIPTHTAHEWGTRHHRKMSFDEEFLALLGKRGVAFGCEICFWLGAAPRALSRMKKTDFS
jgi:hypothetical protein